MAFIREDYCSICKKTTTHVNNRCSRCVSLKDKQIKKAWHKQELNDKLEDLRKRVEDLEQTGHMH